MRNQLMKSAIAILSISALGITTVYADSNQQNDQKVYVVKDVTKQNGFKITYKHFDAQHHVIWSKTINAPAGSLLEIDTVTEAEAIRNHESFVNVNDPDATAKLKTMKAKVRKDAQGETSTSVNAIAEPALSYGQTAYATGSFTTGVRNATVEYGVEYGGSSTAGDLDIYYEDANLSNNPTGGGLYWYDSGYPTGNFQNTIWWHDCGDIQLQIGTASVDFGSDFYGMPSGQEFVTEVDSSTTHAFATQYEGYVTLS